MKKADNFNASKWLVENKITFQSKLIEAKGQEPSKYYPEELYVKSEGEI